MVFIATFIIICAVIALYSEVIKAFKPGGSPEERHQKRTDRRSFLTGVFLGYLIFGIFWLWLQSLQ